MAASSMWGTWPTWGPSAAWRTWPSTSPPPPPCPPWRATSTGTPLLSGVTGLEAGQLAVFDELGRHAPVIHSANYSLGIAVFRRILGEVREVLGEFDVEIVERHHSRKVDAPSGTAFMLADAAAQALPYEPAYIYERRSLRRPREKREIGISSVRGGGIVGDHEVIFAGRDEVIELRHAAMSREVFASGALRAARFLDRVKRPGLYSMKELVAHTI